MTLNVELNAEEAAALSERAAADGTDIETVVHGLIAQLIFRPATGTAKQSALAALLPSRSAAASSDDPEALAEREQELAELKANVDRWRAESGRSH